MKTSHAGCLAFLGLIVSAHAAAVIPSGDNPTTGEPWAPGDSYRLIFLTSASTYPASTDISTYNAWVQGLADSSTVYDIGAADGYVWKVLGSTADVDARDNTSTNPEIDGAGEPVLLLDGSTIVANGYADLWDGTIENGINLTEAGSTGVPWPYTGTYLDGTSVEGVGQSFAVLGGGGSVHQGNSTDTSNWIWRQWTGDTAELPMIALSDPITVVPEPAALALLALGGVLLFRRRV